MPGNGTDKRRGRETRLLILVVGVSVAVLLLLARLRYPAADLNVVTAPAPGPLAGLASQAAFDDMAKAMTQLLGRVAPRVSVVELKRIPESPARGEGSAGGQAAKPDATEPEPAEVVRLAAAFLVRPGLAVLHVPSDFTPVSLLDSGGAAIEIAGSDPVREIALVRVPAAADVRLEPPAEGFSGFAYVGLVGPTRGGPTIQPSFIGKLNGLSRGPWPGALSLEASTALPPGTLAFSIDGRFVGLVIGVEGAPALLPAAMVDAAVSLLSPAGVSGP